MEPPAPVSSVPSIQAGETSHPGGEHTTRERSDTANPVFQISGRNQVDVNIPQRKRVQDTALGKVSRFTRFLCLILNQLRIFFK